MTKLKEELFWMDRNKKGLYEYGYVLDKDDLLTEFPINQNNNSFDTENFLKDVKESPKTVYEGAYDSDDTFTIQKIEYASGNFDESLTYPDYVDNAFRYGERVCFNPYCARTETELERHETFYTLDSYRQHFGLYNSDLMYSPSPTEIATYRIYWAMKEETLTSGYYKSILKELDLDIYLNNAMTLSVDEKYAFATILEIDSVDRLAKRIRVSKESIDDIINSHIVKRKEIAPSYPPIYQDKIGNLYQVVRGKISCLGRDYKHDYCQEEEQEDEPER